MKFAFIAFTLAIGPAAVIAAMLALAGWRKAHGLPTHDPCDDCVCDVCRQNAPSLLEILARDWPEWRGGSRVYQDEEGDLLACESWGTKWVAGSTEIACDRATAVVTEAKWRAAKGVSDAA